MTPGVMPGELVSVVPKDQKNGVTIGQLEEIVEPCGQRRTPFCTSFEKCGGCDWQFIDYSYQVQLKKEIFLECLKRIGKINSECEPEIFSSPETGYRIRAQIKVDPITKRTGFFRKKSNQIIEIKNCPLLSDSLNSILEQLDYTTQLIDKKKVRSINLLAGNNGRVASNPMIRGLTCHETEIKVGNFTFSVGGGSFFQSNAFLLNKLGTWAASDISARKCLDLYGGCGFFSVLLNNCFDQVLLVENVASQVKYAKRNFRQNNAHNSKAFCGDVENSSSEQNIRNFGADCVIVDPPRPGLTRKVREWLAAISPSTLLYVSCNPSTLARDAGFFVNSCGYKIAKSAVFDLYPNTYHLESALLLQK
ncbi:RNA methyltransferase, TrmA family [Chitinispirillum alkaliphilum]|nr:RNA methyltransferase, TrmA family [Chitinispirillum alkaliphilum]